MVQADRAVPFVLMRGGTSKCLFFYDTDLPPERDERDAVLLAAFGSPDPRQIDGLGGARSTTSKAIIVERRARQDADVVFTFAQVSIDKALVDYGGTCGNCSSAVGPFALDEGLLPGVSEPVTPVRAYNTNTGKYLTAEVPVVAGRAAVHGDCHIDGVPGTGAPIKLWFEDPGGSVSGQLLPTGSVRDVVSLPDAGEVEVTLVDAVNPVVFVRAQDLGASGVELPPEIDGNPTLLERLERVRAFGAAAMGLVSSPDEARETTPGIPKVAMVEPPQAYQSLYGDKVDADDVDVAARIMSMGTAHQAYALSGALCTAVAARLPGSVVHDVARSGRGGEFVVGHASGAMSLDVETASGADGAPQITRVAGFRTARRLADGRLYLR